jgi:hypothetical protein
MTSMKRVSRFILGLGVAGTVLLLLVLLNDSSITSFRFDVLSNNLHQFILLFIASTFIATSAILFEWRRE